MAQIQGVQSRPDLLLHPGAADGVPLESDQTRHYPTTLIPSHSWSPHASFLPSILDDYLGQVRGQTGLCNVHMAHPRHGVEPFRRCCISLVFGSVAVPTGIRGGRRKAVQALGRRRNGW